MAFTYPQAVACVHTPLCFADGFNPIYVAPMMVNVDTSDCTTLQVVSTCMVRCNAVTVPSEPYMKLHYPVIASITNRLVKAKKAGASQAFYATALQARDCQTDIGRYVKPSSLSGANTLLEGEAVRARCWQFITLMHYPTHLALIDTVYNKALNGLLVNLFSSGAFPMQVNTTLRPAVEKSITFAIKAVPVIGRYNDLLHIPSGLADIAAVTDLFGLRIGPDNRSIGGIVGFSDPRRIGIKLADGTQIYLNIEPKYIDRIL